MGENGDFQPLHPKISRNSQTVSNAATVTINHQLEFAVDFFARGLHTRTAVARLPLRQLGFLVVFGRLLAISDMSGAHAPLASWPFMGNLRP